MWNRKIWLAFLSLSACNPDLRPVDTDSSLNEIEIELLGIGLSPADPLIQIDETVSFEARAFYSDTSVEVVTDEVIWSVADTRIATISDSGIATGLEPGTTTITATLPDGPAQQVSITVQSGEVILSSVSLTPDPLVIDVDQLASFTATGTYDDDSSGNIANSCDWESHNLEIATVDPTGTVTGISAGSTTITAICGSISDSAAVTVEDVGGGEDPGIAELSITESSMIGNSSSIHWDLTITNQGTAPAPATTLRVYLDLDVPPTSSDSPSLIHTVPPLGIGSSYIVHRDLDDVSSGQHSAYAWVDVTNLCDESDEANNIYGPMSAAVPYGLPDLRIVEFEGVSDGLFTLWTVKIRNSGESDAESFWVDVWDDWFDGDLPGPTAYGNHYEQIDVLEAGASTTLEFETDDGPTDTWYSLVYIDIGDDINEVSESNNWKQIEVIPE